jgi:hypothetical protein
MQGGAGVHAYGVENRSRWGGLVCPAIRGGAALTPSYTQPRVNCARRRRRRRPLGMRQGAAAPEPGVVAPASASASAALAWQVEAASYMEDLKSFVFDESKCVTYKWLSTTLAVSADVSKRMLYEFSEANAAKISATYLVSGVSSEGRRRRFQLVSADKLKTLHETGFAEVQAAHVFSVAPKPVAENMTSPCSSSALWSTEYDANRELYKAEPQFSNCLRDNRHGHVKCAKVTRDLRPRQLFPHSPMPAAAGIATPSSSAAPASARPKMEVGFLSIGQPMPSHELALPAAREPRLAALPSGAIWRGDLHVSTLPVPPDGGMFQEKKAPKKVEAAAGSGAAGACSSSSSAAAAAPSKLSAAEQRMKELNAGGA